MSITRANIANYLDEQFSSLATEIGQTATDESFGYGPDIDNLLRQLGKTESELAAATVNDGDRAKAFALGEYFALRRFWRRLGNRFQHQVGDVAVNYKDQLANVKAMMDDAAALCAELGVGVATSGVELVRLNLDYIEPEPVT